MRRPARPPPPPAADAEVVDLDYGSAETPQLVEEKNEVVDRGTMSPMANEFVPTHRADLAEPPRARKVVAYETEDVDQQALQTNTSQYREIFAESSEEELEDGQFYDDGLPADAVAGPSSSRSSAATFNEAHWPPPPPPAFPPFLAEEPYPPPAHFGYDPTFPNFHPHPPPPPIQLHRAPYAYFPGPAPAPVLQNIHPAAGPSFPPYPTYDQPYDPRPPYSPHTAYGSHSQHFQQQHAYPSYQMISENYPGERHPYPTPLMTPQQQEKRLLKQARKQEKKAKKREKMVKRLDARLNASTTAAAEVELEWIENGRSQALGMIRELHARGVAPGRLVERGVPLTVVFSCCAELGISMQGQAGEANGKGKVVTTAAEDELISKKEQGLALTPLEELRQKVLASRLAKAAAAAQSQVSASREAPSVFDRNPTSGEADALLTQVAETVRSLIRPPAPSTIPIPSEPSAAPSRKRAYHDIDAVIDPSEDPTLTADLGESSISAEAPPPGRRQRISYLDTSTRAPVGEVDLSTPIPDLPDFSHRPTRPRAADFDPEPYRPPPTLVRDRFLDVPSGLNTVIDLSDDELEEELSDETALRHKTQRENWESFRTLNGIPRRDGGTPQPEAENVGGENGTPSREREELLRKELEIKQLMRKIQLMEEERKLKQQLASPNPASYTSAEPEAPANGAAALLTEVPVAVEGTKSDLEDGGKEVVPSTASASGSGGGSSSVKLDPGLQKQREKLLALLAAKREAAAASTTARTPVQPDEPTSSTLDARITATSPSPTPTTTPQKVDEPGPSTLDAQNSATSASTDIRQEPTDSPQPTTSKSTYRPIVPSLFSSVATKFRSFLPPSLGFGFSTSPSRQVDASVRWCPREAAGQGCNEGGCKMRHAAEFDSES